MSLSEQELTARFGFVPPTDVQKAKYGILRLKAHEMAVMLDQTCVDSREKSLAMTKLQESMMWAQRCVAARESQPPAPIKLAGEAQS